MSMSKGFDFLKVPPNSDLLHPRKLLDHSFTSQLPYSASFNDLDNKPVTLKKSSNPGRMDNVVANPMEDPNTNPKRNRLKQLSNAPKVSQRLPSPFSSTTHQRSSPIRRKNIFNKEINTEGELFGVIDNLVNINEFKNTKELLSPLKKRRVPKNDNEEDIEAEMKKKANGRKEKYPLVPLKNYLLLTKLNEVLHKSDDSFRQKIDKVYRTHQGGESFFKKPLQTENIKLNEMITLGTVKPSYGSGVVKKMLHAPTLKILCVKEVPINTRESRQALKVWLEEWQSSFYDSKHNLGVYDMFFNSPEGCLSIVSEYMSGGSIQTLLDSLVSIPEKALKKIGLQTLQALNEVHTRIKKTYGSLSPTQILLDRQGNIKLSLGLRSRISLSNGHHLTKGKSFAEKTLLAEPSPMSEQGSMVPKTLKPKAFNISPESKLHQQAEEDFSQDIFDFGYLMLLCAVGGLEFFDANDFAGKLKILLAELDKKPQDKQKYCCLIHNEDLIWSVKLPHPEEDVFQKKPVKVHRNNNNNNNGVVFDKANSKSTPLISIKDFFVYNNFSKEFLEFLCCCLKFDSTKRSSIPALLSSPFLVKSHIKGPMTSLRELIKISHQWSNNNNLTLKPEHQGASENHLNKLCDALMVVLPNCQQFSAADDNPAKWDVLLKLGPGSQKIKELASELGLTPARVWDSISQVLQAFMEK